MNLQPLIDDLIKFGYEKQIINNLTFIELTILIECHKREAVSVHGRYAGQVLALAAKGLISQKFDAEFGKFLCWIPKEKENE